MNEEKPIRRLVRPRNGRVLAGVCLGLANYLRVDPTIVRIVFFILLIPGGLPGLLPYVLLWVLMPSEK